MLCCAWPGFTVCRDGYCSRSCRFRHFRNAPSQSQKQLIFKLGFTQAHPGLRAPGPAPASAGPIRFVCFAPETTRFMSAGASRYVFGLAAQRTNLKGFVGNSLVNRVWFVRRTNQRKGQGPGPLRGPRGAEPRVGLGEAQRRGRLLGVYADAMTRCTSALPSTPMG